MSQNSSNFETAPSPVEASSGRAVTWARFDPCRDLRASDAVREPCDPQRLAPSLTAAVDTDALDSLFASGSTDVYLSFRYAGYTVEMHSDGWVRVR